MILFYPMPNFINGCYNHFIGICLIYPVFNR